MQRVTKSWWASQILSFKLVLIPWKTNCHRGLSWLGPSSEFKIRHCLFPVSWNSVTAFQYSYFCDYFCVITCHLDLLIKANSPWLIHKSHLKYFIFIFLIYFPEVWLTGAIIKYKATVRLIHSKAEITLKQTMLELHQTSREKHSLPWEKNGKYIFFKYNNWKIKTTISKTCCD